MTKSQLQLLCDSSEAMDLLTYQRKLALLKTHSPSDTLPPSVAILAKALHEAGYVRKTGRAYGDFGQSNSESDHSLDGAFGEDMTVTVTRYLPEFIGATRRFENQGAGTYKNIGERGVAYRFSPSMDDRDDYGPEGPGPGEVVKGEMADGWIKVEIKKDRSHASVSSGQSTPLEVFVEADQNVSLEKPIEAQGTLFHITFERQVGPNQMDLLTVVFHPIAASLDNIAEGVDLLGRVCREEISGDFVTIWDISQMKVPSPFRYPAYSGLLKKRMHECGAFQTSQQGFAVIRGDSRIFNRSVDLMVTLCKAETVPIFSNDLSESLKLLNERFA